MIFIRSRDKSNFILSSVEDESNFTTLELAEALNSSSSLHIIHAHDLEEQSSLTAFHSYNKSLTKRIRITIDNYCHEELIGGELSK
jgi:hypothetical protein